MQRDGSYPQHSQKQTVPNELYSELPIEEEERREECS